VSDWTRCIGPVRDEYGVYCRWGVDEGEKPDCVACGAAADQAALDGADFYTEQIIDKWIESEDEWPTDRQKWPPL